MLQISYLQARVPVGSAHSCQVLARGVAKLFRVGLYCTVHARSEAELAEACAKVKAAAASTLLEVQPATWRHLAGWTTTLPLVTDSLQMLRTMDNAALAAAFPLASPDLPAPAARRGPPVRGSPLRRGPRRSQLKALSGKSTAGGQQRADRGHERAPVSVVMGDSNGTGSAGHLAR
jgi:hypothetical protein